MITLQELCGYLDEYLNCGLYHDFCMNGLQVEGAGQIFKVATAVTANLATIKEAASLGVQALLVHHGLFWNQDPHQIKGSKKEKLKILLNHNISLLTYHLPLDAHQEIGNNWKAAKDLGWEDLKSFCYVKGVPIGVMGTVPPISPVDLAKKLEGYYAHPATHALGGKPEISKIALVSGGAYKSLPDAAEVGVDAFITGSFDLSAWDQAFEEKVHFYALGHTATEKVGPKAMAEMLQQRFGLESLFIDATNEF